MTWGGIELYDRMELPIPERSSASKPDLIRGLICMTKAPCTNPTATMAFREMPNTQELCPPSKHPKLQNHSYTPKAKTRGAVDHRNPPKKASQTSDSHPRDLILSGLHAILVCGGAVPRMQASRNQRYAAK